jgi:hypothetical protein
MAAYHEASLGELNRSTSPTTIDRFRAGELDAFAADHALFQYSRSAKELWKFLHLDAGRNCRPTAILDQPAGVDWWERGARQTA